MKEIVYLNGEFIAKACAKISVLDRGFLFGDGIYEVIPVYQHKAFRLTEHLARLSQCLNQVEIVNPYSNQTWQQLIEQVIEHYPEPHLSIYIQVTRGQQSLRDHTFADSLTPTVLIMPGPMASSVAKLKAIKVQLVSDFRWQHCDIKSTSLLANILLRQQAQNAGFQEAILHRDNIVTEGATSNVFIVSKGVIYTAPKSTHILGGITRDLIIELAAQQQLVLKQQGFTTEQLYQAGEVWISSSSREISPVTQINDKIIANGDIGPVTQKLHRAFQVFKQTLIESN